MAKSSPRVAAHDVHNADLATILTISETTRYINVTIESDEALTILNLPVKELDLQLLRAMGDSYRQISEFILEGGFTVSIIIEGTLQL